MYYKGKEVTIHSQSPTLAFAFSELADIRKAAAERHQKQKPPMCEENS